MHNEHLRLECGRQIARRWILAERVEETEEAGRALQEINEECK